jgi:hypothetical protein
MTKFQSIVRFFQRIILLSVFTILLPLGCKDRSDNYYHVKVQYYKGKADPFIDKRNGIVAFEFLNYFKNDTIILSINNQRFIKEVLTTDEVTGNALLIEVDSLKNIDEVNIVLNSKNKTVINCNNENQLFVVTKKDKNLLIKSVSFFPPNR